MIRVTIKDKEELSNIKPMELELYLVGSLWSVDGGWERGEYKGNRFIKTYSDDVEEILVPSSECMDKPAYPSYMASALMILEKVENKSQLEIWAGIKFLKVEFTSLLED